MAQNDDFGHTNLNPQSISQARHIVSFWDALRQRVYENDWEDKAYEQLVKVEIFRMQNIYKL